jgi:signal transduction histidine kinase
MTDKTTIVTAARHNKNIRERFFKTPLYWAGVILLFAVVITASYFWNTNNINRHAHELGVLRARLVFHMIQTTRSWIAGHGGVFAPDSPELSSLLIREGNLQIHLTSLKPINPANAPAAWEATVLKRFEAGDREHVAVEGGQFRYMSALIVTQTCLQCHAQQGYQLGDIRGGISITQPTTLVSRVVEPQHRTNLVVHVSAFVVISLLLLASLATIRRHVLQLEQERDNRRKTAEMLAAKVAELETAQNELVQSEKMASLGRMVAGFAHEVNTPVGVAVGAVSHALESLEHTEKLLDSEEVSEEALRSGFSTLREASSLALSNLHRAAEMVASFKRTSVDQTSDQMREFDIAQLIDDVFRNQHNTFKRTAIELISDCPENLWLSGPAGALVQVLSNLVINSYLHAFNEGARPGKIRIAVAIEADDRLRINYSDDGAGMPPETLVHLFEPFFTTRRGKGGSGLGMYIVYNLVTQVLRGSIQCESGPGKGMHCVIKFSVQRASAASHA